MRDPVAVISFEDERVIVHEFLGGYADPSGEPYWLWMRDEDLEGMLVEEFFTILFTHFWDYPEGKNVEITRLRNHYLISVKNEAGRLVKDPYVYRHALFDDGGQPFYQILQERITYGNRVRYELARYRGPFFCQICETEFWHYPGMTRVECQDCKDISSEAAVSQNGKVHNPQELEKLATA